MIVDSSVLVAVLTGEPETPDLNRAISAAAEKYISAANYLEAGIVLDSYGSDVGDSLDYYLFKAGIKIEPVTEEQTRIARQAYKTYGKGHHKARLNYGDCFAYALSKAFGLPLLYVGRDFAHTDIGTAR